MLPLRVRIASAQAFENQSWQISRGENPQNANENDSEADEQRIPHEPRNGNGIARQGPQHRRQLQSYDDEYQTVQQKLQHCPHWPALEPGLEGEEFGQAPTEVQTRGHDREHAGNTQSLGGQISHEWR